MIKLAGFVVPCAVVLALTVAARGQDAPRMAKDAHPAFEVASIKMSDPKDQGQGFRIRGQKLIVENETVQSMLVFAFELHKRQILGAPGWGEAQSFDIEGLADTPGEPSVPQMQEMLRKLLADRFGLTFHHEQRDLVHFAVTAPRGAAKLTRSTDGPDAQPDQTGNGDGKALTMRYTNNSMDDFTLGLAFFLDKPVVNRTGLQGKFTFELKWAPDDLKAAEPNDTPGLFTAIRDQLGLGIETVKGPVKVMVIDHIELPSSN